VDVYLLCGDRDAQWLGARGWNFFLVVRRSGRGYWAGPIRPGPGAAVELVIEKYAGLSSARLLPGQ
jgi:hypothetical protein